MDFANINAAIYGNAEDDDDLLEELYALEREEKQKSAATKPKKPNSAAGLIFLDFDVFEQFFGQNWAFFSFWMFKDEGYPYQKIYIVLAVKSGFFIGQP